MEALRVAGKTVELFPARQEGAPLVLLHTVQGEGEAVQREVRKLTAEDFSLAAIGGLAWDEDMSPWPIPPIAKGDTPCTGGADAYLEKLLGEILPQILRQLPGEPRYKALAGYSLAGLFAVYAMYRTGEFSRLASASGSFWYPRFLDFVREREMQGRPDCLYFSLGDREARTRNKILQPVEENTRALQSWYQEMGIRTTLVMNPGNHFQRAKERMAKGISWMLQGGS